MKPTPEQIAAGVVEAKVLIETISIPAFLKHHVTDAAITDAVTKILTAALAAPTKGA
jgi:hypothetical protein